MYVRCRNLTSCGGEVQPEWAFCPHCGADNRPPAERDDVGPHRHTYVGGVGFCLECGAASDGLPVKRRRRLMLRVFAVALFLFFVSLNLRQAGKGQPALFGTWIKSWYDRPTTHEPNWLSSREQRLRGPYSSTVGDDVAGYFTIISGVVFFYGVLLAIGQVIPKSRPKWNGEQF